MRRRRNSWLAAVIGTLGAVVGWSPVLADHDLFRRISAGQINGNGSFNAEFTHATPDGRRAFFYTREKLVAADKDSEYDSYQRYGSTTTLITAGAINGNGPFPAFIDQISSSGTAALFSTDEQLTTSDADASEDVYKRSGGVTTKVSIGNGEFDSRPAGASLDLSRVYFETDERLVAADTDSSDDIYLRSGAATTLMSRGTINGNGAFGVLVDQVSAAGGRVLFETRERLLPADTDSEQDIYMRTTAGTTTLISAGGNGPHSATTGFPPPVSPDLEHIVFMTSERLLGSDTDSSDDLYMRSGAALTHVSIGGNGAFDATPSRITADGSRVFFHTEERLVSGDTDSVHDVYVRAGGTTTRLSLGEKNGNGPHDAFLRGTSADGTSVFFETDERLIASDTDNWQDVYVRQGNKTQLMSRGAINGNGMINAYFEGVSADGTRLFFSTSERLHADDTNGATDVYERYGGATYLLTHAGTSAHYVRASTDGTRVFVETYGPMVGSDTDSGQDVYSVLAGI